MLTLEVRGHPRPFLRLLWAVQGFTWVVLSSGDMETRKPGLGVHLGSRLHFPTPEPGRANAMVAGSRPYVKYVLLNVAIAEHQLAPNETDIDCPIINELHQSILRDPQLACCFKHVHSVPQIVS